jgi:hypothetical protein
MNKFSLAFAVLIAMALFGFATSQAHAGGFGIYFAGPAHYGDYGHHSYYGGWSGGHGWYGDHRWHDTSHYDYHPGEFQRHRNHYHYVPGHFDYHQSGHWDHYHW